MSDLVDKLREAIQEDLRIARGALHNPSRYDPNVGDHVDTGVDDGKWVADRCHVNTANPAHGEGFRGGIIIYDEGGHTEEQAQHIAHFDPDRAIRQAEAFLEILDSYEKLLAQSRALRKAGQQDMATVGGMLALLGAVKALAKVYEIEVER